MTVVCYLTGTSISLVSGLAPPARSPAAAARSPAFFSFCPHACLLASDHSRATARKRAPIASPAHCLSAPAARSLASDEQKKQPTRSRAARERAAYIPDIYSIPGVGGLRRPIEFCIFFTNFHRLVLILGAYSAKYVIHRCRYFISRRPKLFPVYFAGFSNIKLVKKQEIIYMSSRRKKADSCESHISPF